MAGLKEISSKYSTEILKAAMAQTILTEKQIKTALSAKGLKGELLKTTTAEVIQAQTSNALAASEAAAAGTTSSLSLAFNGLATSLGLTTTQLGILLGGITVVAAGFTAFKAIQQHIENVRQATEDAANIYNDTASSIEDYASAIRNYGRHLLLPKKMKKKPITSKNSFWNFKKN